MALTMATKYIRPRSPSSVSS